MSQNNEIVKSGYLTKSPPDDAPPMSQWRRRWFVLRDSLRSYPLAERFVRLEYYQNEGEARKLSDPKGIIDLTNCTRVSGSPPVKGHKFILDICTKDRMYHLAAETPSEKYEWMETLNQLLFKDTNTPQIAHHSHDLEEVEFEIQRKKSQSRPSGRVTEIDRLIPNPQNNFGRPLSYHELGGANRGGVRSELNKNRPLPLTPDEKDNKEPRSLPPIPKPRNKPIRCVSTPETNGKSHSPTDYAEIPDENPMVIPNQPSDYEVPIRTITHGRNSVSSPVISISTKSADYEEVPPIPPPRRKGQIAAVLESTENHCSLPNIYEFADNNSVCDDIDEPYGVLMKMSPIRERRFSESEIITLTPTMPLSTNANSTTPNKDIPVKPIPSPRTRRYYENTGFVPDENEYSRLSHINIQNN